MTSARMHADQVPTSTELVRRLVAEQHPRWRDLSVRPVDSYGTDHDLYRLGKRLVVRLPRTAWVTSQAPKEATWLPRLAPHLPLTLPVQVARGEPGHGYPYDWSVYEWLPGEAASSGGIDLDRAAEDLAAFVVALRAVGTEGAPARPAGARGGPLGEHDDRVRAGIARLGDRIDGQAALRCWTQALEAPEWAGPEQWVHGDLLPGNLLVTDGRLSAVIDWGALGVGDPAADLQPAWNLFGGASRRRFRELLDVDDASWARGRGTTVYQTVAALDYYRDSNPGMVRQAARALGEAVAEA